MRNKQAQIGVRPAVQAAELKAVHTKFDCAFEFTVPRVHIMPATVSVSHFLWQKVLESHILLISKTRVLTYKGGLKRTLPHVYKC